MTGRGTNPDLGEWMSQAAHGDQDAFARLYDAVAPRVHGLVLRVVVDRAQAEEVTQEVFLQVWREAARFEAQRGSVLSWLLTIAHRRAVDRVRSQVAQSKREVVYETRMTTAEVVGTSEQAIRLTEAAEVHHALGGLTMTQRDAVGLAYLHGLTHVEVAERLGVPLGTAKTRIRDGMMALRRQMGGAT